MARDLNVAEEVDSSAWDSHAEVGMHALPVIMEELVSVVRLLLEEEHDAKVRLLI